ncbi:sensor histidine kinase [Spongisporangium articulatum]|uniref:histidine kinase n=1 Tax=Spongisporangium articulatum TaxID=3362603 RepID=A0ABW8AIJ7_9ACTN
MELSLGVLSSVLAGAWGLAAVVELRSGRRSAAGWCLLVAAGHAVAAVAPHAAPVVLATWLGYGLAFPDGALPGAARRVTVALGVLGLTGWAGLLVAQDRSLSPAQFVTGALGVSAVVVVGIALRLRTADAQERAAVEWLGAASVLSAAAVVVLLALHLMAGTPDALRVWLAGPLLLVPLSRILGGLLDRPRLADVVLVQSIVVAGLACLVVAVYLVVVVGLGHVPEGAERGIFVSSLAAAVVVAALAQPVRWRLLDFGTGLIDRSEGSAEEVVNTFGARMSRAVPLDELMLQLVESLKATIAGGGAEIWVGADGVLNRTVSVPHRPTARLTLGERERVVVGRARIGGPSWCSVWLPHLGPRQDDGPRQDVRVAPLAHLGELLGLLVVRRPPGADDFSDDDDRLLVDLARQLGLALHNVRLDSALQASLEELEERNAELAASRLRIVTASDESRRAIERNLHDGAQQHLVALAVKLGLAETLVDEDPEMVTQLLRELRGDVQTTIRELRELAHGIYPPLLRDRGLAEALRAAANRSPLDCTVDVSLPGRFPEAVETATYFCCLEAIQNAGKYAGPAARVTVSVHLNATGDTLEFVVEDDGPGFGVGVAAGHGFVNMGDRLGAIGGSLLIDSTPSRGARVGGLIPIEKASAETVSALTEGTAS